MSVKSGREDERKSLKSGLSGGSKASISVTLPMTEDPHYSPVQVRALSPRRSPDVKHSRRSIYSAGGSQVPLTTPTNIPAYEEEQYKQMHAARVIEKTWLTYQDRQMFKLLKHAVCAAENSLSLEILKKVSPKEAELLKDKSMHSKVRFRFGGSEFPPQILFKIFMGSSQGSSVSYVSGKKMIKPASEAAKDACARMGHRRFYDQLIQDTMQHQKHRITGEVDVTTLKDYMQYMSLLDETPCYMGGRDNMWRRLNLDVLPRHTIFYDIIDYLYNQKMSSLLQAELPTLLANPLSRDVQLRHIQIITKARPVAPVETKAPPKSNYVLPTTQQSGRRSKQAKARAVRMRQAYDQGSEVTSQRRSRRALMRSEEEEEADRLYEWTQELSFDELLTTPRLPTANTQFGITY
ncbi:hypothetical protein CAPTEDRAFT_219983 [Capitella teleta]|uniref:Uncharacterized protein n=1 Tax=Capitella teleta TaxID=283909 RepID=R7TY46_CAPTE|nr:hypothetical protein CAPTEDRAFT_219983 [Capitella teleta]|eukprot:ELT96341.1 hypothetical protein CAPTEDRAFT_219983 [Capitella teleta]